MDAKLYTQQDLFELVLLVGRLLGLSRGTASVFATLYSEDSPLTIEEIVACCGLSKSAVSLVLRDLIQMGAVQEKYFPGERCRRYCGYPDLERVTKDIITEKLQVPLAALSEKLDILEGSHTRLDQVRGLVNHAQTTLAMFQAVKER
jgi:DNA-binding transcriptional regulator GbsR (MarR family)